MSLAARRIGRFAASVAAAAFFIFAQHAAAGEASFAMRLLAADETANVAIGMFPKWTGALARYRHEQALEAAPCTGGNCAVQDWARFVEGLRGQNEMAQLHAVQAYANRVPYQADDSRYGAVDHWATPREFFGRSGDCEDYAFAKYLSLRKLGWSADRLRIVVLMHERRRELHAVLAAQANGTWYILDNLMGGVVDHRAVSYYRPIYSINEIGWFRHYNWAPAANGHYSAVRSDSVRPGSVHPDSVRPGDEGAVLSAPASAYERAAMAPSRRISPTARSYAGSAAESTASIFTGPNTIH